jgi:anhydro-N-acetylmuramic acid kinase
MPQRWIIGLASGSSADGVDAALVELRGVGLDLRLGQMHGLHQPYAPELRDLIRRVAGPAPCEVRQVSRLHRLLGETFAAAARAVADAATLSLQKVLCIGCPGHTLGHEPEGRFPATLALGMAAVAAERCGVTTVSDFRSRDVAAGGQGAPLAALTDHILFRHPSENRLLLHLGGMARLVYLPAGSRLHEVVGFEAGPCNLLLDALIRHVTGGREPYDPGGKHAVQGRCVEPLLASWLAHPALQRRPPRSLPRHAFAEEFAQQALQQVRQQQGRLHDLLCTATHFVVRTITTSIRRYLPSGSTASSPAGPGPRIDRVLLSGGGVRNGLLWRLLEQQLGAIPLGRTDEAGVPAELRKPLSFGLLAALTLDGVPANVPSATGAAGSRLLGSLTPGSSGNWAKCLQWMAQQLSVVGCP